MGLGGFGGSAAAMIQSIRANKAQMKKRDGYFDKKVANDKTYGNFKDHKKFSPDQLIAFKEQLRKEEKARQKRLYSAFGILMIIFIAVLSYFLFF